VAHLKALKKYLHKVETINCPEFEDLYLAPLADTFVIFLLLLGILSEEISKPGISYWS
jgi:hypothetical protein